MTFYLNVQVYGQLSCQSAMIVKLLPPNTPEHNQSSKGLISK